MRPSRRNLWLAPLVLGMACSPAGSADRIAPGAISQRNSTVITTAEIRAADEQNVYDLIAVLRPHWLRKRGANTIRNDGDIAVYLDNGRLGGPETLRQVQTLSVVSIRFFDAAAATYKFGVGHHHGAIQLLVR